MKKKKIKYKKIQNQISIYFSITTVFVLLITLYVFYNIERNNLRENIRKRLENIVSIAALQIDADVHSTLTNPKNENNDNYILIKKTLQNIRDSVDDIFYIYTMRYNKQRQISFVVDAEEDLTKIAHLGEIYDDASLFLKKNIVEITVPVVEEDFYTDKWGTWLSGYVPFYNSNGKIEGILGIDINADIVIKKENELLSLFLIILSSAIPIVIIIGWYIGRKISAPIKRMTESSIKVIEGKKDVVFLEKTNNEIGLLAKAFNKVTNNYNRLIRNLENLERKRTAELQREIIEHKMSEDTLKESEHRLKAFSEATFEGILILKKGVIIDANDSILLMTGYLYNEIIGKHFADLIASEMKTNSKNITSDHEKLYDTIIIRKDKKKIQAEIQGRMVEYKGSIVRVTAIRDITERKRSEQAIRDYGESQELLLREVNHRVKNNLYAISGILYKEKENIKDKDDSVQTVFVDKLINRVDALSAVHSLLSIAKWKPLNLAVLCKELADRLLNDLVLKDKVKVEINQSEVEVNSNQAQQMTLVLNEIITNSMKYARGKKEKLIFKIEIINEKKDIFIKISDNGKGFPQRLLDGNFNNTGIGFDLIFGVINKSLSGSVSIENDNGAVFNIFIRKMV